MPLLIHSETDIFLLSLLHDLICSLRDNISKMETLKKDSSPSERLIDYCLYILNKIHEILNFNYRTEIKAIY